MSSTIFRPDRHQRGMNFPTCASQARLSTISTSSNTYGRVLANVSSCPEKGTRYGDVQGDRGSQPPVSRRGSLSETGA
jgi:hypothetical protein